MAERHALAHRQQPVGRPVERGGRDPEPLATRAAGAAGRRPARPRRPAAGAARPRAAARAAGRSSPRSAPRAPAPRAGRSRRPAASRVSPRGSSSSASGLPRVSATIRSRTASSSANGTAESSSARASPFTRPRTSSSGRCRSSSPGSRAANTSPTGSANSRRATKASVSADAWSSHCASSTMHSSGRSLGRLGEQAEHGEADQERSGAGPALRPKTIRERVALRCRQPLEPVEQRRAQLMQAGERQLHLGLHPAARATVRSGRGRDEVLEQRRLADPGLAAQDQRAALAPAERRDATRPAGRTRPLAPRGASAAPARGDDPLDPSRPPPPHARRSPRASRRTLPHGSSGTTIDRCDDARSRRPGTRPMVPGDRPCQRDTATWGGRSGRGAAMTASRDFGHDVDLGPCKPSAGA